MIFMGDVPSTVFFAIWGFCSLITVPIFLIGVNFCRYFFGMFNYLLFEQVLLYCVVFGLFVAAFAAFHIVLGYRG